MDSRALIYGYERSGVSHDNRTGTVEQSLRQFYDERGWKADGAVSVDAALWEDTRECAVHYVRGCRLRLLDFLPKSGSSLLDAASGPIQYPEYLQYSAGFGVRICVDISAEALKQAETKLGPRGKYLNCSILDLPLEANSVDAAVSLHTIYHIEADSQEKAVRELLRVVKPGAPLLVVYANPDRLSSRIARLARKILGRNELGGHGEIYYHAHPVSWWRRFEGVAEMDIRTWRVLTAKVSRLVAPDNFLGRLFLGALFRLENIFPHASLPFAAYPLIVLRKR